MDFFNKLPHFIGKTVIIIFIVSTIKYIIRSYSINLMDSLYIKIFCLFGLIVIFIISLNYLLKFLITLYFIKDKDVCIPTKLPKKYMNI